MFGVSILTRGMKFWSLKHPKGWTHSSHYPWVMIFAREKTLLKQPSTALWQISALPANQKVPIRTQFQGRSGYDWPGPSRYLFLVMCFFLDVTNQLDSIGIFFGINCLVWWREKLHHTMFFSPIMRSCKCSLQPLLKATDGWPGALRSSIWLGVIHRTLRSATEAGGRLDAEENLGKATCWR